MFQMVPPLGIGSRERFSTKIEAKPEPLKKMLEKNLQYWRCGRNPAATGSTVTFLSRQSESLTESLASPVSSLELGLTLCSLS
jgi:hypothetical protein